MTQLPTQLTIGAIDYKVEAVHNLHSDNGDLYGEVSYAACTISIDDKHTNDQRTPFIVWHEVIHAILEQAGLDDTDEKIAHVLGYGVVKALKDNPYLREVN